MKIGILGGTFDPIHAGHLEICKKALKKFDLNQVWLVPTYQNPLKQKSFLTYQKRLKLCQNFVKNNRKIIVKDFENQSVSTFKLLKKIIAKNPKTEFVFLMGDDNLEKFHLWKNYKSLIKLVEFAIFPRKNSIAKAKKNRAFAIYKKLRNSNLSKNNLPKFTFLTMKKIEISSTLIRKNYDN